MFNLGSAVGYLLLDTTNFKTGFKSALGDLEVFGDKTATAQDKLAGLQSAFTGSGKVLTKNVTAPLAGAGAVALKSSIEFESAFAGVRKTVDATEEEFAGLELGIRSMSKELPASASEIASVAEAAGQLGIEIPNILNFTKTMVDLGESTNMSAEEAANALARLANITGMPQTEFDKLGSVIVELGNNLATTEKEIVDMGLNLAAAGSQVGMSEAQIMALAGALSSVGIEAAAGGTAFSKVMVNMQLAVETGLPAFQELDDELQTVGYSFGDLTQFIETDNKKAVEGLAESLGLTSKQLVKLHTDANDSLGGLENFANVAGMTADEFTVAFQEDAAGAIISFIQGLANAEEQGMSAIKVLDDMEITEVRLRDALLRAGGASDIFTEAIDSATEAWDENIALTNEAEQRYATTESKLKIMKNNFIDVAITLGDILNPYLGGLIESLQGLAERFQQLSPEQQDMIVKLGLIAAAIGPILLLLGSLIKSVTTISSGLGIFKTAMLGAEGSVGLLGKAFSFLAANPVVVIIAAIAALVAVLVNLYKTNEDFRNKVNETWDKIVTGLTNAGISITNTLEGVGIFFQETWEGMITFVTGLPEKFVELGTNVIEGLWKGISGRFKKVTDGVMSFFNEGIVGGIQSLLGIRSPSLVFEGIGYNMIEGLDKGIVDNSGKPIGSTSILVDEIGKYMNKVQEFTRGTVGVIEKQYELWKLNNKDLAGSSEDLSFTLDIQKQKQELLTQEIEVTQKALKDITEQYGETSNEVLTYKNILLDLQIEQANLTNTINDSTEAYMNMADAATAARIKEYDEKRSSSGGSGGSNYKSQRDNYYNAFKDEVDKISKEQDVDLGVAQDIHRNNITNNNNFNITTNEPLDAQGIIRQTQKIIKDLLT